MTLYTHLPEFIAVLPQERRLLGLDVGQARIGVAVSDRQHTIATPLLVLERRTQRQDLGTLARMAREEEAAAFIFGLPKGMDGNETPLCEAIRRFAEKLSERTGLPIYLQDERLSTVAVTRVLEETGLNRKRRQEVDDKLAASYILQGVLDGLRHHR